MPEIDNPLQIAIDNCPFCGNEARYELTITENAVICKKCPAKIVTRNYGFAGSYNQESKILWNIRAPQAVQEELLKRADETVRKLDWIKDLASENGQRLGSNLCNDEIDVMAELLRDLSNYIKGGSND